MIRRSCSREKQVSELTRRSQWPQGASVELREHVRSCDSCADLVTLTSAFKTARAEIIGSAALSSAGAVWWRAQLRRRRAAMERIERPLVRAQIFTLIVGLMAVFGFVGFEAQHGVSWLDWLKGLPQTATTQIADVSTSGRMWMVLAAGAMLALLGGLIIYLVSERQ
jgi:hypothetical protein